MSSYYIDCFENCCTNIKIGTYGTLEEAQIKCQSLAEEHMASDPLNLSIQSIPTTYVTVKTVTVSYDSFGFILSKIYQIIDSRWKIIEIQSHLLL